MSEQTFQCSLITPEAKVYEGAVEFVGIPAHDGEIGIMRDHAPLVCKLGAGEMRVSVGESKENWFIDSGFAQVLDNQVVVLTQKAVRAEDIDRFKAEDLLTEAHRIKVTDDISARKKTHAQASARAMRRMAT